MTNSTTPQTAAKSPAPLALWQVLLAAAGTFAMTMGTRQTMGLFLSALNTSTGLGIGSISLAFAFGQLWWGLTQPFAGAVADRIGTGRVILLGVALVALGTFITPFMTTTAGLIFAIGVLAAGGAGMAGPAVLMAATTRLLPADKRGMATGIVNAGGSFGQFVMAPIAGALMVSVGWGNAMQVLAGIVLLALPVVSLAVRGKPSSLQSLLILHFVLGTALVPSGMGALWIYNGAGDSSPRSAHLVNQLLTLARAEPESAVLQDRVPVVNGIRQVPNLPRLKHFGAAASSSGGVEMYHIVGVTPEASTREQAFGGSGHDVVPLVPPLLLPA